MGYKILIADDDPELVKMLQTFFKLRKYIVFTVADGAETLNGLMSGGDDYILKPFSLKELEARITSHLKREERRRGKSSYRFQGDLTIDYSARTVQVSGHNVELTKLEYGIIEFLSMNPGFVYDKERIYEKVCGYDAEGDSRVITELVRRIRKKLQKYTDAEYIETVWSTGYLRQTRYLHSSLKKKFKGN